MNNYINYEDIKEFYNKIVNAPVIEDDPDYLLGVDNGKIVKISEW